MTLSKSYYEFVKIQLNTDTFFPQWISRITQFPASFLYLGKWFVSCFQFECVRESACMEITIAYYLKGTAILTAHIYNVT